VRYAKKNLAFFLGESGNEKKRGIKFDSVLGHAQRRKS
jgi:hypothetical protein